jgi:uncharacterized membrane protein YhaH (DUF805 family)
MNRLGLHGLFFSRSIDRLIFVFRLCLTIAVEICGLQLHRVAFAEMASRRLGSVREAAPVWLLSAAFIGLTLLATAYLLLFAAGPRLRSIGLSAWYALVLLIPLTLVRVPGLLFLAICPPGAIRRREPSLAAAKRFPPQA